MTELGNAEFGGMTNRVSKPLRTDELQQIGVQPRHVGEHQRVRRALVDLELAIGNELRHPRAGERKRRRCVIVASKQQGRHADARQPGA